MFAHIAVQPDSWSQRHFFMCTCDSKSSFRSFSVVARTSIGPTIHAKTIFVIAALSSRENAFTGNSFRKTASPPGGIKLVMMSNVMSRWPAKSLPRICRKHRAMNSS